MASTLLPAASDLVEKWLSRNAEKPRLLVVLGSTATGKTSLAIELAKSFSGEILSADSRAVWQEPAIGTTKPSLAEQRGVPHHLLDLSSLREEFSLWRWLSAAKETSGEICARENLPILAGGTGLFVEALVENFLLANRDTELRSSLEKRFREGGGEPLLAELTNLLPGEAEGLSPRSREHLLRTLERARLSSRPGKGQRKFDALLLGIRFLSRAAREEAIVARLEEMLAAGWLEEVARLAESFSDKEIARAGIGYPELLAVTRGEFSLSAAKEKIVIATRQFAKRQDTWWRRWERAGAEIHWLDREG